MLRDSIDLRKYKWQQRRKVEGPKKIEDVHGDARKNGKLKLADLVVSIRKGPSMDFAPRTPSMLSPRGPQISRFCPGGPQLCGHGSLDAQMDERHSYENRMMYISLPQRPLGHDSITLGQGGLVRGMTSGSQPSAYSSCMAEIWRCTQGGPWSNWIQFYSRTGSLWPKRGSHAKICVRKVCCSIPL